MSYFLNIISLNKIGKRISASVMKLIETRPTLGDELQLKISKAGSASRFENKANTYKSRARLLIQSPLIRIKQSEKIRIDFKVKSQSKKS